MDSEILPVKKKRVSLKRDLDETDDSAESTDPMPYVSPSKDNREGDFFARIGLWEMPKKSSFAS